MSLLNYRIIQFFDNPMREEGRNIGIIAYDGHQAWFRSLGMIEGLDKPDLSQFRAVAAAAKNDIWVFGEWIQWFKDLCLETEGRTDAINSELDRLANQSPQFGATVGGYYELGELRPETAVQELFDELVGTPRRQGKPKFKEMVDEVLMRSEVTFRSGFDESIEVTINQPESDQPVHFILDYYLDARSRVGFKLIQFKGTHAKVLSERVNDAIYAFSEAQRLGFLEKDKCVVLSDSPTKGKIPFLNRLRSVATVIDVSEREASRKIFDICS